MMPTVVEKGNNASDSVGDDTSNETHDVTPSRTMEDKNHTSQAQIIHSEDYDDEDDNRVVDGELDDSDNEIGVPSTQGPIDQVEEKKCSVEDSSLAAHAAEVESASSTHHIQLSTENSDNPDISSDSQQTLSQPISISHSPGILKTTKVATTSGPPPESEEDDIGDNNKEEDPASSSSKKKVIPKTACGYPIPPPLKGMMMKMATGFLKHWNKRYFQLERGALIYFEPVHWYLKGQYDLVGLEVSPSCENRDDLLIKLVAPERPEVLFQTEDMEMKDKWIKGLKEHIAFANYVSIQVKKSMEMPVSEASTMRKTSSRNKAKSVIAPTLAHGWLYKKGQIFPTIRRRYFLLQEGFISYYKQDLRDLLPTNPIDGMNFSAHDARNHVDAIRPTEEQQKQIPRPLGRFSIYDYQLYSDSSDGRIELLLMPGLQSRSKRKMFIYCDNYADRDRWVKAFNEHSCYVANVA